MSKSVFDKILKENKFLFKSYYPDKKHIFKALEICPIENTKVVILGQDPYHGENQAHGLAFSVPEFIPIPPSLRNIFKELSSDLEISNPKHGDLTSWAKQGVLLLNTVLTVQPGKPGSHQKIGWEDYTDSIIKKLNDEKKHLVYMLWGKNAQTKEALIDIGKNLILKAPHPSPLSAYRGFWGCKHFSKCNAYLKSKKVRGINWEL